MLKPFEREGLYINLPEVVTVVSEHNCIAVYSKYGLAEVSTNVKGFWFYSE
jgi:hypothetical protein